MASASLFAPPAVEVARSLIGRRLFHGGCSGVIVETEAYAGDEASHYVTRKPSAGALMGGTHGLLYVYSIYGMHLCLNFTADATGPGAVLLRALEPVEGLELMRQRRGVERLEDLCAGPGRLVQALGVTRALHGLPVLEHFELGPAARGVEVVASPRVGISAARELPWRFSLAGSRFVSRPRPRG